MGRVPFGLLLFPGEVGVFCLFCLPAKNGGVDLFLHTHTHTKKDVFSIATCGECAISGPMKGSTSFLTSGLSLSSPAKTGAQNDPFHRNVVFPGTSLKHGI